MMDFEPGTHVLADFFGARHLSDAEALQNAMSDAAQEAGATVLHTHFHSFPGQASGTGGVTGVVMLAESHITIHTWPEADLAALDIFMCGAMSVDLALAHLERALRPTRKQVTHVPRGSDLT